MHSLIRLRCSVLRSMGAGALLAALAVMPAGARLVISEIQTSNEDTLRDEDGDAPDWLELFNEADTPQSLAGWALLEQAVTRWEFPDITVPGRARLVVFASGKNRREPGAPLHTSFRLATGEALALLKATGEVAWSVAALPAVPVGTSWGEHQPSQDTPLITPTTPLRWQARAELLTDETWRELGADEAAWSAGQGTLGFALPRPGVAVERFRFFGPVNDARTLQVALTQPGLREAEAARLLPTLDFADGETATEVGRFPGGAVRPVPGDAVRRLYRLSGQITIPRAGAWTLAVGSGRSGATYWGEIGTASFGSLFGGGWPVPVDTGLPIEGFVEAKYVVDLAAGQVPFMLWFTEPAGASIFEVSLAEGDRSAEEGLGEAFHLLGSAAGPMITASPAAALAAHIDTQLPVRTDAPGVAVRIPFLWAAAPNERLSLRVAYADAVRVWLDGREVLVNREVPPAEVPFRTAEQALREERFELPASATAGLSAGPHMLAIELTPAVENASSAFLRVGLVAHQATGPTATAWFATPTPGQPNAEPTGPPLEPPQMSPLRGFYTAPQTVTLSTATPEAQIFYTLDGCEPEPGTASLYAGPIPVAQTTVVRARAFAPGWLPSKTASHTFFFPASQAAQARGALPSAWGTERAYYTFGQSENEPTARDLSETLTALPSLSLALPPNAAFGELGMMAFSDVRGNLSAHRTSVEWIWPEGVNYQEDATLRIKGEASRQPGFPKHGLRLDFPGSTGGPLDRLIFSETNRENINTVMLHGSFVDNTFTLRRKAQFIRDLWARDTLRTMGWPAPHGDFFHVYLNGLYWGLYHAGERADAAWCAASLGGAPEEWDVIADGEVVDGRKAEWEVFYNLLSQGEATEENYAAVTAQLDVPAFIDYMLVNFYAVNIDWPVHNWYVAKRRTPGSKWRFLTWDAEYSFDRVTQNLLPEIDQIMSGGPGEALRFLVRFEPFRRQFADQVRRHFYDEGALTPTEAETTWMRRAGQVAEAIPAEMARWGDVDVYGGPGGAPERAVTTADWRAELDRLRREWFPQRSRLLLRQLRAVGLFPDVTPPVLTPASGYGPAGRTVTLSNRGFDSEIFYTLDGSDPATSDGTPALQALALAGPITINGSITIRARGWFDGEMSAETRGHYAVGSDPLALRITEIHFSPSGPAASGRPEFIELWNGGSTPLPLDGLKLEEAVRFTFPSSVVLASQGYAVVVRDAVAFAQAFPGVAIHGVYAGALADEGETLVLRHPIVGVLETIHFRAHSPWPTARGGANGSLQRTSFGDRSALASAWVNARPRPGQATDPALADGDADGLPDAWERAEGTRMTASDALADPDRDGFDNRQEFLAATRPRDGSDFLRIADVQINAGTGRVVLSFNAAAERRYRVEHSKNLAGPWVVVGEVTPGAVSSLTEVELTADESEVGFYRLVLPR